MLPPASAPRSQRDGYVSARLRPTLIPVLITAALARKHRSAVALVHIGQDLAQRSNDQVGALRACRSRGYVGRPPHYQNRLQPGRLGSRDVEVGGIAHVQRLVGPGLMTRQS